MRLRPTVVASVIVAAVAVYSIPPSARGDVTSGFDYWETPPAGAEYDFSAEPIPQDFFAPNSEPFAGTICLGGEPLDNWNTGTADSIIERLAPANLPEPPPATDVVPIRLVQLSLVSCSPIIVTYPGAPPEQWSVAVDLSTVQPPEGEMTITKEHPNGGMFTSQIYVLPRLTFTRVSDSTVRTLDTGLDGRQPQLLQSTGLIPWVSNCDWPFVASAGSGEHFCAGVDVGGVRVSAQHAGNGAQQTLIAACTDNDLDGVGSCVDNCPFSANPGQENLDNDAEGDRCDYDDDNDGVWDDHEVACGSDPMDVTPPLSRPERIDGVFHEADDDGDSQIDEPLPPDAEYFDCDGDGYKGLDESGDPFCRNSQSDDGFDGYTNDGCPAVGAAEVDCANNYDDDLDGRVNDGCPAQGVYSEGAFNIGTSDQDPCGTNGWPSDLVSGGIPDSTNRVNLLDLTSFLSPVRRINMQLADPAFDPRWDLKPGAGLYMSYLINIEDLTRLLGGWSGYPAMLGDTRAFGGPDCPW